MTTEREIRIVFGIKTRIVNAGFRLNPYATEYINALAQSADEGGLEGLIVQCIYIASNLRASGDDQKRVKKWLIESRSHKFKDI